MSGATVDRAGELERDMSRDTQPDDGHTLASRIGELIAGKYRVLSHIGSGGMGSVYRAEHVRLGHFVAVKILARRLASHPHFATRFEREARSAAKLRSIHAVRVHDVDMLEDGTPFIVMELLEGNDLYQELKRGRIPLAELITWILQVCAAIGEAHALGIVHRDLKLANIFIARHRDGSPHREGAGFRAVEVHGRAKEAHGRRHRHWDIAVHVSRAASGR